SSVGVAEPVDAGVSVGFARSVVPVASVGVSRSAVAAGSVGSDGSVVPAAAADVDGPAGSAEAVEPMFSVVSAVPGIAGFAAAGECPGSADGVRFVCFESSSFGVDLLGMESLLKVCVIAPGPFGGRAVQLDRSVVGRFGGRKDHADPGAGAGDGDGAAVQVDHPAGDGESETGATAVGAAAAGETVEDALALGGWYAGAVVFDIDDEVTARGVGAQPDLTAGRTVPGGVVQEVQQHLVQAGAVGVDGRGLRFGCAAEADSAA